MASNVAPEPAAREPTGTVVRNRDFASTAMPMAVAMTRAALLARPAVATNVAQTIRNVVVKAMRRLAATTGSDVAREPVVPAPTGIAVRVVGSVSTAMQTAAAMMATVLLERPAAQTSAVRPIKIAAARARRRPVATTV
jgi:hypothetical protein